MDTGYITIIKIIKSDKKERKKKMKEVPPLLCYLPSLSLIRTNKEAPFISPPSSSLPTPQTQTRDSRNRPRPTTKQGPNPPIAEAPRSPELERRRKVGSWRGWGDGRRDLVHGGEIRLLPAEPAVVQGGAGRRAGAPHPELLPAPGERGGA